MAASFAGNPEKAPPAVLLVIHPSGNRTHMDLRPLPFLIGRQADNQLILRDTRASRHHAQIAFEEGSWWIEDLKSRHGVFVNGFPVTRQKLAQGDRIEFGFPDSYRLVFSPQETTMQKAVEEVLSAATKSSLPGGENLSKLRAVVEVARALESSFSTDDVLVAVVDAALTVTGTERGFLLLKSGTEDLEVRVARDSRGSPLAETDLRIPTRVINRALQQRRDLLSMNFDPGEGGIEPTHTVAALELRSVVCVPLVKIRSGNVEETKVAAPQNETVGLLYLDSRVGRADLASGNRELLTTLAIEASTVLENARLLEEERAKQRMEEEMKIARQIQESLQPRVLPQDGWFQAAGRSIPSQDVGGDYFDVQQISPSRWAALVADVSGKGVSAALLASFLQGVLLAAVENRAQVDSTLQRVNHFLLDRTEGGKYATLCVCTLDEDGTLRWTNAGHCHPYVVSPDGSLRTLASTGMPVGLIEGATFPMEEMRVEPGTKIVLYSDGVTEARSPQKDFFGEERLERVLKNGNKSTALEIYREIERSLQEFTLGSNQSDDITVVVVDYRPGGAGQASRS